MANILEFLRGVLTDPEAQRALDADADGYLTRAGLGDLTGEDIVEAVGVLRRSLPAEVATALATFDDEGAIPAVRPGLGERELDAAIRQLRHAVAVVGGVAVPVGADGALAPPPPPPIEPEVEPELAEPVPVAEAAPPWPAHEEAIAVETEPAPTAPTAPEPVGVDVSDLPSVEALGAAVAAAAADAKALLDEYANDVRERLAAVLDQAERDVADLRAGAQADRDAARQVLLDAREEAQRIIADIEEGRAELDARRAELREAEREMKERVAALDDVFRSVLKDE